MEKEQLKNLIDDDVVGPITDAQSTLRVLLRTCSTALAEMPAIEEKVLESELPSSGLSRWVTASELVVRALQELRCAAENAAALPGMFGEHPTEGTGVAKPGARP